MADVSTYDAASSMSSSAERIDCARVPMPRPGPPTPVTLAVSAASVAADSSELDSAAASVRGCATVSALPDSSGGGVLPSPPGSGLADRVTAAEPALDDRP